LARPPQQFLDQNVWIPHRPQGETAAAVPPFNAGDLRQNCSSSPVSSNSSNPRRDRAIGSNFRELIPHAPRRNLRISGGACTRRRIPSERAALNAEPQKRAAKRTARSNRKLVLSKAADPVRQCPMIPPGGQPAANKVEHSPSRAASATAFYREIARCTSSCGVRGTPHCPDAPIGEPHRPETSPLYLQPVSRTTIAPESRARQPRLSGKKRHDPIRSSVRRHVVIRWLGPSKISRHAPPPAAPDDRAQKCFANRLASSRGVITHYATRIPPGIGLYPKFNRDLSALAFHGRRCAILVL